jgi:tetratricopeptide (TPR) repeat protein
MMAEATKKSSRIALLAAACAAALSAGLIAGSPLSAAAQSQPQGQQQPKKPKKLPPGAKGFAQYATRDASDKLATGGATRGLDDDFKLAMKQGDELYDAGKYREAAQHYARATRLKPDVFRAFYSLGAAHEGAGQFKEAAAAYKTAVSLKPDPISDDPNDPIKLQYALANSQAAAGLHAEAVNTYRQVIDLLEKAGARAANPYYNLALSLDAVGRQQEAVAALQKAVEISPDYAEAHYNLGVIHSRAERYGEAVESFKRALAARADYPEALYNLGLAYYLTDNNAGLAEQRRKLQALNSPLAAELAKLAGR